MNDTYQKRTFRLPTKITAIFTLCAFLLNLIVPQVVIAQSTISLPVPGTMVSMSAVFQPTVLRAVTIDPQNPFQFDFVIDAGQSQLSNDELKEESTKLVKYFLTSLTVPEKDIWVNLSPFEKDKIVPNEFGITEMGKDLLSQDYLLKQLTATLIYPEVELGKLFWDKVYEKAQTLFGTTNIPISTFNKIWIVPDKAVVYEKGHTAFVVEAHLKVMLEEDYLAFLKSFNKEEQTPNTEELGNVTSSTLKEMIIPEIEKEINQGKNFTQLRQIYYSLILASWYKKRLKESLLSKIYTDQNKVVGIDVEDRNIKQKIYEQYLEAYKQGVYNFIKETYDPTSQEMIPRKYFSGGVTALGLADEKMEIVQTPPEPESYTPLRRPLKIKVNLVRHSVVNEYIRTHLPDDLIDDPQNIENYPDGVIPIKGLFQETGQMGHIGLGQVYGRPVKYVDEEYKDNEDLLGHEDDEITQWENKREKLGLRPREMREWILNNYDEAKKLADQYHNKARSVEHLYDGMDITEIYSSDSDERDTNLAAHTEKLPRVNKEEELVVFSTVGFERHLIRGTEIWKNFKKEVGEAAKYAGPTKTIKVGEENFILVRRQSGRHIVFTLDQERFEKLVRLKDWSFKSTVPDAAANDVIFSYVGFDKYLISGQGVWRTFKKEIGEADEYTEPTKIMKVGEENFTLIRKRSGTNIVFTLDQERFKQLVRLKGWSFKAKVPDAAASDVSFSQTSFDKYLVGGARVWQTFREEIGEAKEYPEPAKIMKAGEENFTLIRKRSGSNIVFTLDQKKFEQLVRLKGWIFKTKVPDAAASDVIFSQISFDKYLVGGGGVWQTFREEIGEAKEYPEPTKSINVGVEKYILIRKRSGGGHTVFTLNQEKFERLARLK
ncbi:MAG: hypothetical protein KBD53_11765, partial [Candidatus Omnitrophica bacterium]|nr:hypothetical protein [Candidatus Omnitrophota bacterium]